MKKLLLAVAMLIATQSLPAQQPCSSPEYRQFDFWIGEWEAFGKNGQKAGDSKISQILGSCIILEEWTSANNTQGIRYAGKSFNIYNSSTKQWQQTWVDNVGGSTEYLQGEGSMGKVVFKTNPFAFKKDTMAIRRLSFYKLEENKVRQHGEISKDNGKNWVTEYDLEYRKKKETPVQVVDEILRNMEKEYNSGNYENIASFYSKNGKVIGRNTIVSGEEELKKYWKSFSSLAGTWTLTNEKTEQVENLIWQKGSSLIKDKEGRDHKVSFTLIFAKENGIWKILQDAYW